MASQGSINDGLRPDAVPCTKVQIPVLRDDAIARGRLLQAVHEMLDRYPVLLVSAPPGYGKTTLLASLPIACSHARVAWVTLDEDDDEPARFLSATAASLSVVAPTVSASAIHVAEPGTVIDAWINELSRYEHVMLVLDELQQVREPAVLGCIARLVERLPRSMRLAIATRHRPALPVARWKARRLVREIGPEELAFTSEEVKEYLSFAYGIEVSDAVAHELAERAEGWPAAVTLLAGTMASGGAAPAEHRDIDALIEQEVFAALDTDLRRFVLETSVLSELTPASCEAVTERSDAPALLGEIVRLHLVVPVNQTGTTFRYHGMFRRFLERRLVAELPGAVPGLKRRAAVVRDGSRGPGSTVRVPETGAVLSPREIEVLRLVAAGASNAEIADKLFISIHTVKRHVATLLDKLGASSRSRAAAAARRLGIVP